MTKYDELAYLYSREHSQECCDFANFLAQKLANHMECSREAIRFTNNAGAHVDCTEADIKEIKKGFVCITIAVALPDENVVGSNVSVDIRLQKDQHRFLVRMNNEPHTYLLFKEESIDTSKFCDDLFNFFVDRKIR